ncbi:DUF3558 domain-containing protein [Actinopolyspora mortivallis]|uniref:DUF3558 domain-containing protein n=1 Tax=Actinopolyspora mortivallis TaxID=33906 RepID=A0A2T0H227_ACTMO|nr:DUF3558 domain-containing protein [Actinopolyspora mortivallis]
MAAVAGAVLVGLSACSPGGNTDHAPTETTDASPSDEVLSEVTPCEMLPPDTLRSFGLQVPGKPTDGLPWTPACDYTGDPVGVTLVKNTRQTVASSEKKSTWASFDRITVNGRPGATAITKGSTQAQICNVLFDAGQGMIQVRAQESGRSDEIDECAKALEIAERIEPNVPEPA